MIQLCCQQQMLTALSLEDGRLFVQKWNNWFTSLIGFART